MNERPAARPVTVRPRLPEDLPSAGAALVRVHASDGYPVEGVADPVGWLLPEGLAAAWVAVVDGEVAGHVAVVEAGGALVLVRLFVVREVRRGGAGEALVRAAEGFARERGRGLELEVLGKDRAAMRLYERLGWRRGGELVHEFGAGERAAGARYLAP
ncbi:GNAT family N-acetyltransferase [Streptomyces sp. NPDC047046]|uniref:GNAT family N-acetyltransferase n=1 Tax=Streptomyces sp. NPDC047046 TaxID=3155378 RepID=UPI0033F02370